jgi:hypothetical protein
MTMSAIRHLTAFSLSVSSPRRSGTYRIGAASVSILRPRAATRARSAFRAARVPASRFRASASSPRILRWPSIAERTVLVRPRFATSSIVGSGRGAGQDQRPDNTRSGRSTPTIFITRTCLIWWRIICLPGSLWIRRRSSSSASPRRATERTDSTSSRGEAEESRRWSRRRAAGPQLRFSRKRRDCMELFRD